ncbi:MAG: hypothetical protein M3146_08640 [Thermoproteota archaeon]|nr:hypothetical protein [Thermoproteota archaeon]
MTYLSFPESFLAVLISVTAILGIITASPPGSSAYGQPSHNLMNFIPSADNPANQPQISKGGQQLIIIPSLSDDDIAIMEEQAKNNEKGRQQGQELDSIQTSLENEEEKIKENLEEAIKYQENNDIRNEEKYNFNNDNEVPLELPFP